MNALLNWLDDRTGYKVLLHEALYERVPGGARWRYVWGSTLVFTFVTQMVTGIFLWMAYSPSAQTAWESIYFIQYEMQLGWLLRGIHHFTAQAMIVLLALHLMQVVIDGAYKAPREVNFWLGLILMQIVLGLSLTGYLLPWDQKGYWATKVATSIAGITPVVGTQVQQLAVGGDEYGHHTLTRFFALHAGLLPALLLGFLGLHLYVFRRHGITVPNPIYKPDTTFWPDQVLKDSVACLAVLATVLFLCAWRHAGPEGGADLGAPADASEPYSAARPEWYFLFLFQFLKYFPGETEILGAMVIPGAVMGFLFLMPFVGRWKLGHGFNIGFLFIVLGGAAWLTFEAVRLDRNDPDYVRAALDAEVKAARIKELIPLRGISSAGAVHLLRADAKTQGPVLFAKKCASCHTHNGTDGTGKTLEEPATAADLGKFGTCAWIHEMITDPAGEKHFGATTRGSFNGEPLGARFTKGKMAEWVAENVKSKMMKDDEVKAVVEFLFQQSEHAAEAPANSQLAEKGQAFFVDGSDAVTESCASCHVMRVKGELITDETPPNVAGPVLTGYASRQWLRDFIRDPGHKNFYGKRNAMPAFQGDLSDKEIDLLVDWLLHRWPEPARE